MTPRYLQIARLLTQVAPLVLADDTSALKGGTAINPFIRNMPRLSVDLDLVFPDHTLGRDAALARITDALREATSRLEARGFTSRTQSLPDVGETKLLVRRDGIEVKVEVNYVTRGTVHPVRRSSLVANAREALQADLEIPIASFEDLSSCSL
jgi:hypothetical protein